MAKGVCQRFAQCAQRIKRIVSSLEQAGNNATCNWQVLTQKVVGQPQQAKCVAVKLAIVGELRLVDSSETCDAQQTLRKPCFQKFVSAKQDRGGSQNLPISHQSQSSQQCFRLASSGVALTASSNRFVDRASDFRSIEVADSPPVRRFVLPPPFAVKALHQHLVVLVAGHRDGCVANTPVSAATDDIRAVLAAGDRHDQNFSAASGRNPFDRRECRWVDLLSLLCQFFDGALTDLLAGNNTTRLDTDNNTSA